MMTRISLGLGVALLSISIAGCARPVNLPPTTDSSAVEGGAACNSWTCAGCCSGGQCKAGKDPGLCGVSGAACRVCASGQSCPQGSCTTLAACSAATCPDGCCDGAICRAGETDASCGSGGAACQSCAAGQVCSGHACVATAACSGGRLIPVEGMALFGAACNAGALLAADEKVAGLDRIGSESTSIGGQPMASCAAVDFGRAVLLDTIVVRARAAGQGCSKACLPTYCGQGQGMAVFHSTVNASASYVYVGAPTKITSSFVEYPYTIGKEVRYVAVCRETWGEEKDDVTVDSIHGTCH